MESDEGVSLPWFHKHLMVPCNFTTRGDCCGCKETSTAGYYCKRCKFFIHKKCSESPEYIQHPSHPLHPLCLRRKPNSYCAICGQTAVISYCCLICDFDIHLYCAKYTPPKVIENSEMHHHELTLAERWELKFDCYAKCGKIGKGYPYKCHECELNFHADCVWYPLEAINLLEYTTMNAGERVSLPWIHEHSMVPWNDLRKGDCCGRAETTTDSYYCTSCDFFIHKKCGEKAPESIQHPSHPRHPLWLQITSNYDCDLCGKTILDVSYSCKICSFHIDLHCVKYPPPEVIENLKMHHEKLNLFKERTRFFCDAKKCGNIGENEFSYKSHECDLTFHVDCVWVPSELDMPLELNNSYHSLHPLKLQMGRLNYFSDGKCRLCGREIDYRLFYHCSSCNFSLDMRCVLHPPPQSIMDLKAHEHQLTLLLRLDSFKCNACSLKEYRSRYVCFQCGFMIHRDCLDLPRLINVNRHDHRVSRTSVFGVIKYKCGVCRDDVDWAYGGYSCQRCLDYVVHSKCATRGDVWNGKELEGIPKK